MTAIGAKSTSPASPDNLIEHLRDQIDLRANSTIITIFGDALLPRGGKIWLGSLIALAGSFGISERLVRTGVYRLAREGWLESRSQGRRARYHLTDAGNEKFNEAQQRIYAAEPVEWDGSWRLIHLLASMPAPERQAIRSEMGWSGFGQISPNLFAHPTRTAKDIERLLERNAAFAHTLTFEAETALFTDRNHIRNVVRETWMLDDLNLEYGRFVNVFTPILESVSRKPPDPRQAFELRILMIHDYRRVLLKDPDLPDDLMPRDWKGITARNLCAAIYRQLVGQAETYLDETLDDTALGKAARQAVLSNRFAGPGKHTI
jgi:phenylacetic acid degradation operon negative regulatory protein